jgi:hypothetical protein
MGFTAFPPDFTPEAVLSTRKFVKENADLICHPIEGVPWTQAHSGLELWISLALRRCPPLYFPGPSIHHLCSPRALTPLAVSGQ